MSSFAHDPRWRGPRYFLSSKWRNALIVVTNQLAELVRANAPLLGGLIALAAEAPSSKLRELLLALRRDIASGLSLHQAMERCSDFFPRYYTDLVKSGEDTGRLCEALCELEERLIQLSSFRDKVRNYLLYIGIVFFIELLIAAQMVVFVVPQFTWIYAGFNAPLPQTTRALVAVADYLRQWQALVIIFAVVAIGIGLWSSIPVFSQRDSFVSRVLGRIFLWVPFLRGVIVRRDSAHIASVLHKLLKAGLTLNDALEDAAELDVNPRFKDALHRIKRRIEEGRSFRDALESEGKVFPESFRGLAALGENAGLLPEALAQIADLHRREALMNAHILLDIAAPTAVCLVGALVFVIYSGLFSAIFGLSSLVTPPY